MNKKFIVRLSDEERAICQEIIKKLSGSSQKFVALRFCSRRMPTGQDGRIAELPMRSTAAYKRSRTSANVW
jgi:hypothetical protein